MQGQRLPVWALCAGVCGVVLALPALYLLGREMGGTWLGLTAAGLAAWSK